MNNIIIELCAEDRARLDNIIEALKGLAAGATEAPAKKEAAKKAPAAKKETPAAAAEPEAPAAEPEAKPEVPWTEPEAPAEVVTIAELQSKVVQLVGAGKKDAAREIVTSYAKSVSEIPEDKRAEVLRRLKELEG